MTVANGERSVLTLPGVGPAVATRLERLGVMTVDDLLWHLPRTWLDLTNPQPIAVLQPDTFAVIRATITEVTAERTARRRMSVLHAEFQDAAGDTIGAVWFNQPFLADRLRVGSEWLVYGAVKRLFGSRQLQLQSPKFATTPAILPIYPETDGLTSFQLRRSIRPLLDELAGSDWLPLSFRRREQLVDRAAALRSLHAPTTMTEVTTGRTRLALDELVRLFLVLGQRRSARRSGTAPAIPTPVANLKTFVRSLPFQLTDAQRRASWQILKDLERPTPMARLLLGDVGSGKTIVALIAAYAALQRGERVAWLTPTQLLAEQHIATTERFLPSDVARPVLVSATSKPAALDRVPFLIGTHALLGADRTGAPFGLVIIDEQHRFGVKQRQTLVSGDVRHRPHLLSMTATPIPRSLALTVFGDLDCSFLDQVPSGRKPVVTRVIEPAKRSVAYDLVATELAAGRQVFVICPTIEPNPTITRFDFDADHRAATKRFASLQADPRFAQFQLGLLHGRLKPADKQSIMERFSSNQLQLLVATSLIEVGIDVPNATVLVIEGAEHFGLAQLHQLRGRVGRGAKQSLCIAIADVWSPLAQERLAAFEQSTNGFELAELDLTLRGPGDLLGDLQAGLPPLKLATLTDTLLIDRARTLAAELADLAQADPAFAARLAFKIEEENGGDRAPAPTVPNAPDGGHRERPPRVQRTARVPFDRSSAARGSRHRLG